MSRAERPHRVAVLAHGHPSRSAGGAEIAAHTLHVTLSEMPDVSSLHVACVPEGHPLAVQQITPGSSGCFVESAMSDPFYLSNRDPAMLSRLLDALRQFRPDTVHLHHILGFGADALFQIRKALPEAAIVLTLHEYIPICHHQGQMVRVGSLDLCSRATPSDCSRCFPEIAPVRFLRRERALLSQFSHVDHFIAPSAFLAKRYADWGLPEQKVTVIENALAPLDAVAAPTPLRSGRGRFAFFGQFTPYKGIEVLLAAAASLSTEEWKGCTLDIHGGGLDRQPSDYRERVSALMHRAERVTVHGPYANSALPALMEDIDWVIVPSVWWENSPLVIQEAFRSRRPVITSDIGGMAEKVRHGIDGLTFRTGDAAELAKRMVEAKSSALWEELSRNTRPPAAAQSTARRHLELYRSIDRANAPEAGTAVLHHNSHRSVKADPACSGSRLDPIASAFR